VIYVAFLSLDSHIVGCILTTFVAARQHRTRSGDVDTEKGDPSFWGSRGIGQQRGSAGFN